MQGFLFSHPANAGPGRALVPPGPVVVAYEPVVRSGQGVLFSWPVNGSRWGAPAPFRVVLLYEDFATGKWARRVCRFLDAQAGAGGFEQGLWRCESLEGRQVQSRVAGAVARADMVIFSVYSDLPAGTGALLGAWLEGKRWHDSALMAMVVDGAGVPATQADRSVITRLAHLARDHGLKFVRERLEIQDGPRQGTWELAWVF